MSKLSLAASLVVGLSASAFAADWHMSSDRSYATVANGWLVEAEGFDDLGGWTIDQQFMNRMGSPYLLAHGLGKPVADAKTHVQLAKLGKYHLWVRTRAWAGPNGPGEFQVLVNGKVAGTFGRGGSGAWEWWDGGEVEIDVLPAEVVLHDLTGFEGRVDAIHFNPGGDVTRPSNEADFAWRRPLLGLPKITPVAGEYDFVVVGGGFAGMCAAVAAARDGLKVALVQDRPVFGGNGSVEINIRSLGELGVGPYPHNSDLMLELSKLKGAEYGAWLAAEKNLTVYAFTRAVGAAVEGGRIASVTIRDVRTSRESILRGKFFCDATGDASLAEAAGVKTMWDAEPREETGEELAPPKGKRSCAGGLGSSNKWSAKLDPSKAGHSFPACPWALAVNDRADALVGNELKGGLCLGGGWNWEAGYYRDPVKEGEAIRDLNFRAVYGLWDYLKNRAPNREKYRTAELETLAFLLGKRDAHRIPGDYVLTANDMLNRKPQPDGVVTTTWYLDLHFPHPTIERKFPGEAFRALSYECPTYRELSSPDWVGCLMAIKPYEIPFRCLYSRDVPNLFMAGKDISGTFVALASYRVQNTGAQMGAVVGRAAAICVARGWTPRELGKEHFNVLKERLRK